MAVQRAVVLCASGAGGKTILKLISTLVSGGNDGRERNQGRRKQGERERCIWRGKTENEGKASSSLSSSSSSSSLPIPRWKMNSVFRNEDASSAGEEGMRKDSCMRGRKRL